MMDRRAFIGTMAGGLLAGPLAVEAQQMGKIPRIGFLEANRGFDHAFQEGLRQLSYVEGKNIVIEWRWTQARADRFPELAAELVRLKVAIIVATNNPAVAAAQKATKTIPIVMVIVTDPVRLGFVASLARPGGNITGLTTQSPALAAKRLQLLKETVPNMTRGGPPLGLRLPGRRARSIDITKFAWEIILRYLGATAEEITYRRGWGGGE